MPNYRAYIVQTRYRAFEFEADDEGLAWDHMETLMSNYGDRIMSLADESGPDEITLDDIEEF